MRDFRSILTILGLLLCIEAIAMTIPMFYDLYYSNEDWVQFFYSSLIIFFIGIILNISFRKKNIKLGKAGRKRYLGYRPKVRGVVMNPVDHPHGGGEGRSSGGRHPVTPWGVPTKGKRTRGKKPSDKYIMRRRYKR